MLLTRKTRNTNNVKDKKLLKYDEIECTGYSIGRQSKINNSIKYGKDIRY